MFGKSIFFFYKALLFGIATITVIPRQVYKRFLIYGFIFGAIGDVIMATILGPILQLIKYLNMGPFNIFGIVSFWTPIAWMFAFMLFFYFLPVRRVFLYPYIIGFSIFGYMVGLVLQQLDLYQYIGNYIYFAPIVNVIWFSISAYVYIKNGNIFLK
ncbi:hypothetical protein [Desulfolucanica intricata]|uniref:hypothetical protein n=1 Tax=Desulfolucanica intricata TaxID=1285191 RepID=UPI0008361C2F|nr:hypothetical protein [Desulfolucanica intricata]